MGSEFAILIPFSVKSSPKIAQSSYERWKQVFGKSWAFLRAIGVM